MTAIPIQIVSPRHGDVLVGVTQVALIGAAQAPAMLTGVPLYYRWYSSLFAAQKDRYSLHPTALEDPSAPYLAALQPGSQAITLGASDRSGETAADQNATQHGGVTGGAGGPTPCVVHVLTAVLVRPSAGATVSQANVEFAARAPPTWDKPDYAQLNRLRYRFMVTPSTGAPVEVAPAEFLIDSGVPLIRYRGPLPAALKPGPATLTLRVEDAQHANVGHQTSLSVTLTA